MKSTPTARLVISSCWAPTIPSRVRPIFALGSTLLPVAGRTPVVVLKRELLAVGLPVNSFNWTTPSRFESVQQDDPVHSPVVLFGPHVKNVDVNRPVGEFASVIFVS